MVNQFRRLQMGVTWLLAGVIWAGAIGGGLSRTTAWAKDRFPYTVYTAADDAPVLSGPGEAFYATDLLPAGIPLEVHGREPGGWLAIRPPEKSFSWVPAQKLHVAVGDRSARVVADDAVSWIGSRVETVADHRWQVTLDRGERVVVLGHRELSDDKKGTNETWYQIAPPNGEFRYIHADDVQRRRPTGEETPLATADGASLESDGAEEPMSRDREARTVAAETPVRRADSRGGRAERDAGVTPVQYRSEWSPRAAARQPRRFDAVDSAAAQDVPAPPTSPELSRGLEDLTLQLTQLSTQDPGLWNLAPLRASAEALVERGATPLERGKARLMLDKIEEFEDLQQRHIRAERSSSLPATMTAAAAPSGPASFLGGASPGTPSGAGPIGMSGLSVPALDSTSPNPVGTGLVAQGWSSFMRTFNSGVGAPAANAASPQIEPRFDGTGWLVPVHSTKKVAPPYALLDDQGKVLQYITPSPGLNLHRYERKRVGLYGQKGAVPTLNAPHITAHRIIDLDRQASRVQ
ncbi:MAG: hypothetical protein U0939_02555 [Pirellulales bacterium]